YSTSLVIGVGHESQGLYYLKQILLCLVLLLHDLLGHPNLSMLKQMVLGLQKLKVLDCESCQLGKHVYSSFQKQIEKYGTLHQSSCPYTPQQNGITK
ncbi:hypothetical protein CR513_47752, partial [Mucuna pruriens]